MSDRRRLQLSVLLQSCLIGGRLLWSLLALILLKNSQFSLKDFQNSLEIHCRYFSILQGRDAFKGGLLGNGANTRAGRESAGSPSALPFAFSSHCLNSNPRIAGHDRKKSLEKSPANESNVVESFAQRPNPSLC